MGELGPVEAAELVADFIAGTANNTVADALELHGLPASYVDDKTFCSALDQLVFECSVCNWFCSIDELSDDTDMVCDDCADE